MDFELLIRTEAKSDLLDIFNWYQEQKAGLGFEFKLCVDEVITRICRFPTSCKKIYFEIRRAFLKKFPIGVFYIIDNQTIIVLAVIHARRAPKNWKVKIIRDQ